MFSGVLGFPLCKAQNNAAHFIGGSARSDPAHVSDPSCSTGWFHVQSRIQYKIIVLTFKALNNQAPSYLTDLIQLYVPSR